MKYLIFMLTFSVLGLCIIDSPETQLKEVNEINEVEVKPDESPIKDSNPVLSPIKKTAKENPGDSVTNKHIQTGTVTDYYADLPSIESVTSSYEGVDTEILQAKIGASKIEMSKDAWIERANAGELSEDELRQLAAMMQTESAMHLVLIRRSLNELEEEFL